MKPFSALLAATCAGLLAGCSSWPGHEVSQAQYLPMHGGPGYGSMSPMSGENAVPGGPAPITAQINSDADDFGGGGYGAVGGSGYTGTTGSGGSGMSNPTGNVGGGSSGSEETGSANTSASGGSAAGAASSGAPLDQQSMCELQRRVSAARTEEERQALMEQAMPGMTQAAREQHLQMMRESCQ